MVSVQSLPEGTDVVVGTLYEGLAGDVISHGLLRGVDCKKKGPVSKVHGEEVEEGSEADVHSLW